MSKSTQVDQDGYAVEVSLLRFKPVVLVLSAACLIAMVSLSSWLGLGNGRQLAAPEVVRNNGANQNFQEIPTVSNNATSQDAKPSRAADAPVTDEPSDREPAAAAAPEPVGAASVAGVAGYAVQAGSYSTVSEANERVSGLRAAGFEARVATVELEKRGTWYRVYSGRFALREEAKQHENKLRASGAVGNTIIAAVQE